MTTHAERRNMNSDSRSDRGPKKPRDGSGSGSRGASRGGSSGRGGSIRGGSSQRDAGAGRGSGPGGGSSGGGWSRDGFDRKEGAGKNDQSSGGPRRDRKPPQRGTPDERARARYDRGQDRAAGAGSGPRRVYNDDKTATERRGRRADEVPKIEAPEIPEEVEFADLDKPTRARMRTLSKDNADDVGRHMVMVGALLDIDPELAYKHALVAVARGGRVDVVREAMALAAYATGRYAEALRELRTVRRLNGESENLALMADCERGLGRPERALALTQSDEAKGISPEASAELQIVAAGARLDLGQADAAVATLRAIEAPTPEVLERAEGALVDAYRAAGKEDQANALEQKLTKRALERGPEEPIELDTFVYDTATEEVVEDEFAPQTADADADVSPGKEPNANGANEEGGDSNAPGIVGDAAAPTAPRAAADPEEAA